MMQVERIYTHVGRQRPVFLAEGQGMAFVLEVPDGCRAHVAVTHDPVEAVKRGVALWERFEGGAHGVVRGVTALRAVVEAVQGWVVLRTGT